MRAYYIKKQRVMPDGWKEKEGLERGKTGTFYQKKRVSDLRRF